jgi:hypothetical protein
MIAFELLHVNHKHWCTLKHIYFRVGQKKLNQKYLIIFSFYIALETQKHLEKTSDIKISLVQKTSMSEAST